MKSRRKGKKMREGDYKRRKEITREKKKIRVVNQGVERKREVHGKYENRIVSERSKMNRGQKKTM